jgi:penicillin-binding protein 1C
MASKPRIIKYGIIAVLVLITLPVGALVVRTRLDLQPAPRSLTFDSTDPETRLRKIQILDRDHVPLTVTYQNRWNLHDHVPLHGIPAFLRQAFVVSEDQRFYQHRGVDWKARLHAVWQNLREWRAVRGASTISEQVVRMWRPRPRTLWSRWLEGFEAARLENRFSKAEILEFYLNQVPYAGRRRGVVQAASSYFDRDLDTLNEKEMLALAVMVRAPSRMNPNRGTGGIQRFIERLTQRMVRNGYMDPARQSLICKSKVRIRTPEPPVDAGHFVHHIYRTVPASRLHTRARLHTTLSADLQYRVKRILDNALLLFEKRGVKNGAVLMLDHRRSEILAWVNGGEKSDDVPGSRIDAVTTPRQPGSTLKPFLYARALEMGWTASTILVDAPIAEPIGRGLHDVHNYSRTYYGRLRLRDALANSLNTPAVRTIRFVGLENFLQLLRDLGCSSLTQHPDYYGEGIALGNGEITLLELVGAYAVLGARGIRYPVRLLMDEEFMSHSPMRIFSPGVTSIIGDILSDPNARRLEFGNGGLLRFPVQTAVKTGTSSDYRDAWAVGFNRSYTVGVWMGNLDNTATAGVTGALGPALVLRSVFAELNRHQNTGPLYLSPGLMKLEICKKSGLPFLGDCPRITEWFVPGTEPKMDSNLYPNPESVTDNPSGSETEPVHVVRPTNGLEMAMDPRIPDDREAFCFSLSAVPEGAEVDWYLNGSRIAANAGRRMIWPLRRGTHDVYAEVRYNEVPRAFITRPVRFVVK